MAMKESSPTSQNDVFLYRFYEMSLDYCTKLCSIKVLTTDSSLNTCFAMKTVDSCTEQFQRSETVVFV